MRPIILMIAAMIIACYPKAAFSQAEINSGTNVTAYVPVHSWENYYVTLPSINAQYSMNDFVDEEEYKIVSLQDSPNIITDLQMYIAESYPADGVVLFTPLPSDFEFSYHPNYSFMVQFKMPSTATIGQTQLLRFQIYRKRFGVWDWQTSFYIYVETTCMTNQTFNSGTLGGIDYEVGGTLTAATTAFPNGGLTELDGGQSVILNPGFSTNLSGGGAVQAIIDGCGGAYRPANNSSIDNTSPVRQSALNKGDVSVYPNPATDKCTVNFPTALEGKELTLELMDINGRILYSHKEVSKPNAEIDLRNFETGIYFISISGEGINYNQKLIKQ